MLLLSIGFLLIMDCEIAGGGVWEDLFKASRSGKGTVYFFCHFHLLSKRPLNPDHPDS